MAIAMYKLHEKLTAFLNTSIKHCFKGFAHFQQRRAKNLAVSEASNKGEHFAIHWQPLPGFKHSAPRKLLAVNAHRIEFLPSIQAMAAYVGIMVFGILACLSSLHMLHVDPTKARLLLMIGVVAISVGFWAKYFLANRLVLDTELGFFGKATAEATASQAKAGNHVSIQNVHVLQILQEQKYRKNIDTGTTSAFTLYELNFVLTNGKRCNIICSPKWHKIEEAAQHIATMLNVDILYATGLEKLNTQSPSTNASFSLSHKTS